MPITFTDQMVTDRLAMCGLETSGEMPIRRERLAAYIEGRFDDYVEAWEIRTGRPWDEMTASEAQQLVNRRPH